MLMLLLQAAQQAQQIAPNLYVTVQPPPAGMPEWEKAVLAAGVGAAFAVVGNVVMEFVKPAVQRRGFARQLMTELAETISYLEAIDSVIRKRRSQMPLEEIPAFRQSLVEIIQGISSRRFDYFTSNQQSVVYEIPGFGMMMNFYSILRSGEWEDLEAIRARLIVLLVAGKAVLRANGFRSVKDLTIAEGLIKSIIIQATEPSSTG